jgi:hypothetical protein
MVDALQRMGLLQREGPPFYNFSTYLTLVGYPYTTTGYLPLQVYRRAPQPRLTSSSLHHQGGKYQGDFGVWTPDSLDDPAHHERTASGFLVRSK